MCSLSSYDINPIAAPRLEPGRRQVWQFLLVGSVGKRPQNRGKAQGDHGHPLGPRQQPPSHRLRRSENSGCSDVLFKPALSGQIS